MIVLDVMKALDEIAPFNTAEDFDNVGLLVGEKNSKVLNVLICLDLTKNVLKEAILKKAELIVSHHPVIFNPLKKVLKKDLVFELISNNISVICAHTNLDRADFGVSSLLANAIGLLDVHELQESMGFGRVGMLKNPLDSISFAKYVSKKLGTVVKFSKSSKKINKVAVVSGSGCFLIKAAQKAGVDAFVTGESKHEVFINANWQDFCFVDASHFATEKIFSKPLAEKLKEKFKLSGVNFFAVEEESPYGFVFGENIWG